MSWLPDTMFGRLFVAVCVPISAMLVISYSLVMADRQTLALQLGGAGATVTEIVGLTGQWLPLDASARAVAISEYNRTTAETRRTPSQRGEGRSMEGEWRGAVAGRISDDPADRRDDIEIMYLTPLRRQLGSTCKVSSSPADFTASEVADLSAPPDQSRREGELASAARGGGRGGQTRGRVEGRRIGPLDLRVSCGSAAALLFRVPTPPPLPSYDTTLVWELLALTGMLGAALWFTTRRLTRPLTELQQVANAMGRASPPPQIKESGAREIRASLRAFNTMQDRLHRYLDSRTRVLAAMSHDLRTPLTRLRLRAETVDQPEVRTRLVADIEEMDSLVHRSLGLFRGLDDSEPLTAVDVDALLQALAAECAEMGQSLPIKGQAGAPLLARAQSLRRSLRNLIDNAFKYGGKAHIEVRDTPQELVISVCDQGPGIPEDQLQSVCEPFRRLESSRSRETGGVGLGLAIAADVAEQHGGNLQLCNRPEGGLAANLRLPRKH